MAPSSSSSAKKVAKLAQRGKGKKVRFQGGTLFPVVVLVVVVLGLLTIVYARQSRPDPGDQPPQVGDHWHAAYGIYVCDTWLPTLDGDRSETVTDPQTGQEVLVDDLFQLTGVHSHDDGVIHWHPRSTRAVGSRATFGLFLDVYDVELSEDELVIPPEQGGGSYQADDFQCDGQDVQITVRAWDSYTDTGEGTTYITDLEDVRLVNDGMVFVIAVTPPGTDVAMPGWAKDLPALGAADGSGQVPSDTTAPGDTTGGTATGDTTGGTATGDTATGDTATGDTSTGDTSTGDTTTDATGTPTTATAPAPETTGG